MKSKSKINDATLETLSAGRLTMRFADGSSANILEMHKHKDENGRTTSISITTDAPDGSEHQHFDLSTRSRFMRRFYNTITNEFNRGTYINSDRTI